MNIGLGEQLLVLSKGGFLSEKSVGFLLFPNLHNKYFLLLS